MQTSPARVHRRSRHHLSSLSSPTTSLPSVQDEPESPTLDDVMGDWPNNHGLERRHPSKHSSSSETSSANDSGYSSASKLLNPGSNLDDGKINDNFNSNMRVLRRGVEIERAWIINERLHCCDPWTIKIPYTVRTLKLAACELDEYRELP